VGLRVGVGVGVCDAGRVAAWTPASLAPYEYWRGDAVGLADPVASWASTGSKGNALAQSNATFKPAYVASYAPLGSQPVVHASGTNKFLGTGAGSVTDYKFLHNGAGMTIALVADITVESAVRQILSTQLLLALANVGCLLYLDASNRVNFATGNVTIQVVAAQSSALTSGPRVIVVRYSSTRGTAGTRAEMRIGRAVNGTSGEAATPSSANASDQLRVTASAAATFGATARVAELMLLDRVLTDTEVSTYESYVLGRYGV